MTWCYNCARFCFMSNTTINFLNENNIDQIHFALLLTLLSIKCNILWFLLYFESEDTLLPSKKRLIHILIMCRMTTNIINYNHFISDFFQHLIYWTSETLCPRYKNCFLYFVSHSIIKIKNKWNYVLLDNKMRLFYLFVTFAFYKKTNIVISIINFNIINVDWKQNI